MAIQLTPLAREKSTYVIEASFKDEDGTAVVPNSASWTLTDDAGTVIHARSGVVISPLAATVDIVLSGLDLAMQTGEVSRALRRLTIEALYDSTLGTGLPVKEEFLFTVKDLLKVT